MSQSGILKVADSILPPDVPTLFVEDVGSAIPISNILNIFGSGGITTSGIGNTVTITNGPTIAITYTGNTGTATPALNNLNVFGASVAALGVPVATIASGSTVTVNVQRTSSSATSVAANAGISSFNSSQFTVDANGFVSATGTIPITTTENSGAATPSGGNLNIFGTNNALTGYSPWTTGSGATATVNMPGTVKWVVNATAGLGTHTTIQAAITAASSGDDVFITPGTYTENITLKAGVNLTSYGGDDSFNGTGNVQISGKLSFSSAGTVNIFGIQLNTNSDNFLAVSGSSASLVNLVNCYLNCSNATGISFTTSNASSVIIVDNCSGNIGTTGISLYSMSSTGTLSLSNTGISNSGLSTTASSNSSGIVGFNFCNVGFAISCSSTGFVTNIYTIFSCNAINTTCITTTGTGLSAFYHCVFTSGTASAASAGTGTQITLDFCDFNSVNTNAITGSGQVNVRGLVFSGVSSRINTTAMTGGAISGLTQGTAPSAGFIGEQIRSSVTIGSPVTIPASTNTVNVTSINLTAGIWDVSGIVQFNATGANTTSSQTIGGISSVSANINGQGDNTAYGPAPTTTGAAGATNVLGVYIPSFRVTLSATTTYYLVAYGQASVSFGMNAFGRISATRVG